MRPYFEEKQYESYFVQEIGRETKLTFAPGQVEEKQLGFDFGCALTPEAWKRCFDKVVEVADGDLGQGASGEVIEKALELLQHTMPPFNMNLFIQFKRSDYMPSARCREFGYWKKPYFRYGIAKDQLATLIALAEGCGELAHVVYAAPVFHKREDLFAAQLAGQVIARSNVVEARELKRHKHYTFAAPGGNGRGYSEPEDIESEEIWSRITRLSRQGGTGRMGVAKHARSLSRGVHAALEIAGCGALFKDCFATAFPTRPISISGLLGSLRPAFSQKCSH